MNNTTGPHLDGRLPQIHDNVRAQAPPLLRRSSKLPESFTPGAYDVICGKGKQCFNHIGNRRFRITVELHLPRYTQSPSRVEKSSIVASIVDIVRSTGAIGFVKRDADSGDWFDVGDHAAREKVGQTIRDILKQRDPVRRARKNLLRQQARAAKARKGTMTWHQPRNNNSRNVHVATTVPSSSSVAMQQQQQQQLTHDGGATVTNALFTSTFLPTKPSGEQDIAADPVLSQMADWSLFKMHELSNMLPPMQTAPPATMQACPTLIAEKQHCC